MSQLTLRQHAEKYMTEMDYRSLEICVEILGNSLAEKEMVLNELKGLRSGSKKGYTGLDEDLKSWGFDASELSTLIFRLKLQMSIVKRMNNVLC